jgi:HTH-type transcriptional regulator / antitoxin HipB
MVKPRRLELSMQERASQLADLARLVRARREYLGLRQDELAELAGCSARFVHTVEHAKANVQLDKLLAVLGALGLRLVVRRGKGGVVVDA